MYTEGHWYVSPAPRPRPFWFSVSIIHWSRRIAKKGESHGTLIMWRDTRDIRGAASLYKFMSIILWTRFLPVKQSTLNLVNILGSCLAMKCLMVESSMLFKCGTIPPQHPPCVHLHDMCSQPSPFFPVLLCTSVYYTECKLKNKKWGRPRNKAIVVCQVYCIYRKQICIIATHWTLWNGQYRMANFTCKEHRDSQRTAKGKV